MNVITFENTVHICNALELEGVIVQYGLKNKDNVEGQQHL